MEEGVREGAGMNGEQRCCLPEKPCVLSVTEWVRGVKKGWVAGRPVAEEKSTFSDALL